jgi:transcriptional regulator with XRE-family HTH domain
MTGGRPKAARAPSEMDLRVSARLRAHRLACSMTLVELSGLLGISHQQLQKYETGMNRISAGMLYEVAKRLGVPLADFFSCDEANDDDFASQSPTA